MSKRQTLRKGWQERATVSSLTASTIWGLWPWCVSELCAPLGSNMWPNYFKSNTTILFYLSHDQKLKTSCEYAVVDTIMNMMKSTFTSIKIFHVYDIGEYRTTSPHLAHWSHGGNTLCHSVGYDVKPAGFIYSPKCVTEANPQWDSTCRLPAFVLLIILVRIHWLVSPLVHLSVQISPSFYTCHRKTVVT